MGIHRLRATMNVSLTPQLESFVRSKVETGRYTSSSEVVREALRLLEQFEDVRQRKLDALNADLAEAARSLDAGEGTPLDVAEIKREGRARRAAAGATAAARG